MPPKKLVIIEEIKIKPILGYEILVSILVAVSRYNRNDWNLTLPLYSCYSCIHDSSLQLYNYTTIILYNYTAIQLYNYTTIQLYNYTTIQLYNYTTIQLYNYIFLHRMVNNHDSCC